MVLRNAMSVSRSGGDYGKKATLPPAQGALRSNKVGTAEPAPQKASQAYGDLSGQTKRKILSLPATTSTLSHPATKIMYKMARNDQRSETQEMSPWFFDRRKTASE